MEAAGLGAWLVEQGTRATSYLTVVHSTYLEVVIATLLLLVKVRIRLPRPHMAKREKGSAFGP